jgi:aldose sugar dehydrogenase
VNDIVASHCPSFNIPLRAITWLLIPIFVAFTLTIFGLITTPCHSVAAYPTILDPNLKVETVAKGIRFPTSMAFLAKDDILVLEKDNGTIKRIINGQVQTEPLIDLDVANQGERGMLGIATSKNVNGSAYVFLYLTESSSGSDYGNDSASSEPPRNRLYRYEWLNGSLSNPTLLLDLPAVPGPNHNGGKIAIGPDRNVYISIGNLNDKQIKSYLTQAENSKEGNPPDGKLPDGRAGILRITQDGNAVLNDNMTSLSDGDPLDKYYAYGIRNSFGLAFDPVTGKLWDTENGPDYADEINLVEPGFNSGWLKIQGIWKPAQNGGKAGKINLIPDDLTNFGGKGNYSLPEFIWFNTVGVTGLDFVNSDKYGEQYENDLFVGDFKHGNLYHFDLNKNRTGLYLREPLVDRMAQKPNELQNVIAGQGFGGITDVELGPDGYLYILAATHDSVFRIVPSSQK